MNRVDTLEAVERAARATIWQEQFNEAVTLRVAELRAEPGKKSLWQRLVSKLPFTITWRKA